MPNLSIRKIDQSIYDLLKVKAAEHGVSMEEEVRRIIKESVSTPQQLGQLAKKLFSDVHEEIEIPKREIYDPVDFTR